MCKAMIVDDSSIFRDAFKTELIRHIPWILVQEAKDGREAMEKIQRMSAFPHIRGYAFARCGRSTACPKN